MLAADLVNAVNTGCKELNWVLARTKPNEYSLPGSRWFRGTLPGRMAESIRAYARARNARHSDGQHNASYTWRENGDIIVTLRYGVHRSTQSSIELYLSADLPEDGYKD